MSTFRFLNFKAYKGSKDFYKRILIISEKIKNFYFRDQIRRAVLSIILNIAEGSSKKSDKEFARFLEISIGSVNEVVACLDVMKSIEKISEKDYTNLVENSEELVKQLGGFIKKLRKS